MSDDNNNNADRMWEILEDGPRQWYTRVQEDANGDCFIEFTPELLTLVDWHEGDTIDWHDNGDGTFTLTKV